MFGRTSARGPDRRQSSPPMFDALQTAATADRVALQFPDRSLTYGELDRASAALAASLADARCVAIVAENRIETCVAVVAAIRAGVPAVPLNPRSGTAELAHIVADAAPDAVLTAPGTEPPPALAAARRIAVELDHDPPPAPSDDRAAAAPGARRSRADRLHLGHHRPAQGRGDAPARDRDQSRRAGGDLGVDRDATSSPTRCRCSTCTGS